MRHAASILSHILYGMRHFMRHAPSQCLTPYSSLIFDVECEALSHGPFECLTPYVMSHSMSNLKLHASCTISMSNTVCHDSFHVECFMRCAS